MRHMKPSRLTRRASLLGAPLLCLLLWGTCSTCPVRAADAPTAQASVPKKASPPLDRYKGTLLPDLLDKRHDPAQAMGTHGYATAFQRITQAQTRNDRRFIARLTSGPSTRGELVDTPTGPAILHVTCQAHACDVARMAVLFEPTTGRMTGLLWNQCHRTPLGQPTPSEIDLMSRLGSIPANTADTQQHCERER